MIQYLLHEHHLACEGLIKLTYLHFTNCISLLWRNRLILLIYSGCLLGFTIKLYQLLGEINRQATILLFVCVIVN